MKQETISKLRKLIQFKHRSSDGKRWEVTMPEIKAVFPGSSEQIDLLLAMLESEGYVVKIEGVIVHFDINKISPVNKRYYDKYSKTMKPLD